LYLNKNFDKFRLVIMEFLNNEDVKKLYIYSKPGSIMTAAKTCQSESSYEKGIFFLKISNTSKLTPENLSIKI